MKKRSNTSGMIFEGLDYYAADRARVKPALLLKQPHHLQDPAAFLLLMR
jgi:hypothetical protein